MNKNLLTLILVLSALWSAAHGMTLKIATVAPDGTAWMREIRAAGARVEERTGGRVDLKFYPGGVMGNAATVRRKMRVGQLHGGVFTGGEISAVDPDMYLLSIPFLFRDLDEVAFVRKRLEPLLNEGMADGGMQMLGLAGGGFAYLMSDTPVASKADLAKVKVWLPEGDLVSRIALEEAGASPVALTLADVYTGLQTGLIDTVVNTPSGAIAFQWHTKLKYVTDLPVTYVLGVLAVDKRAYDRLSAADQQVLSDELGGAMRTLEAINADDNTGARAALLNQGLQEIDPEDSSRAFWRSIGPATADRLAKGDQLKFDHLQQLLQWLEAYRARSDASP